MDNIVRWPAALKASGYRSKTRVLELIAQGKFPRQVPLGGGRAVGFLQSELEQWQQSRINERDGGQS